MSFNEPSYKRRLVEQGFDSEEIEEILTELGDRQCDEMRDARLDRELDDLHVLQMAELHDPYGC